MTIGRIIVLALVILLAAIDGWAVGTVYHGWGVLLGVPTGFLIGTGASHWLEKAGW